MKDQNWLQLTLLAGTYSTQQLEDAFLASGALAVTLQDAADDPVLEPAPGVTPLWPRTQVTGLFSAQTDLTVVQQQLRAHLDTDTLPACAVGTLAERDWVRAWLDDFQAMRFGRRLWVCPSHIAPPQPAAVNIILDPGLAFGTGTHPTTALCLEWLDTALLEKATVLDYGCGSGILALAAAKLGAERVWAVDIDPQALLACEQNALRNDLAQSIITLVPDALPPTVTVDVLLANILAQPLISLASHFSTIVTSGGYLVLSGILQQQAHAVMSAYAPWFTFDKPVHRAEWALLSATRITA